MGNNLNIVTSNEHNDLTSYRRRQDVEAIYAQFAATEPIVLWQEIKKVEDHGDIDHKAPAGTQHLFPDLPIPITVPSWYTVTEQFSVQTKENTAPGYAGPGTGYDTGSAARWYAVARLKDTTRPNLPEFYVINTHFTNGCDWDNKRTDDADDDLNAFLRPYWNAHWDMLKAEIDRLKDNSPGDPNAVPPVEPGLDSTVFYGGDFNRKDSPPFGSAEKLAVGNGQIDKLAVIDRSVQTALKTTGVIPTNSDHQAHWARWELTVRP